MLRWIREKLELPTQASLDRQGQGRLWHLSEQWEGMRGRRDWDAFQSPTETCTGPGAQPLQMSICGLVGEGGKSTQGMAGMCVTPHHPGCPLKKYQSRVTCAAMSTGSLGSSVRLRYGWPMPLVQLSPGDLLRSVLPNTKGCTTLGFLFPGHQLQSHEALQDGWWQGHPRFRVSMLLLGLWVGISIQDMFEKPSFFQLFWKHQRFSSGTGIAGDSMFGSSVSYTEPRTWKYA